MKDTALNEIIKEFKKDQSEGSTYFVWQSNIAMAIFNELDGKVTLEEANRCAKRFLTVLINYFTTKDK